MIIPNRKNKPKKALKNPVTFRIDNNIVSEFKTLCKLKKISQSSIMENAMKIAIAELKDLAHDN